MIKIPKKKKVSKVSKAPVLDKTQKLDTPCQLSMLAKWLPTDPRGTDSKLRSFFKCFLKFVVHDWLINTKPNCGANVSSKRPKQRSVRLGIVVLLSIRNFSQRKPQQMENGIGPIKSFSILYSFHINWCEKVFSLRRVCFAEKMIGKKGCFL